MTDRYQLLSQWKAASDLSTKATSDELDLRRQVFAAFFPVANEGAGTVDLNAGWALKGTRKISRSIDRATLNDTLLKIPPELAADLIKWSPSLALATYRKLTVEQQHVFNETLIIKDGTPSLQLVPPKDTKP